MKRILQSNHLHKYVHQTGAQAIYQSFVDHNVDHIFGYTGGTILSVTDVLYKNK